MKFNLTPKWWSVVVWLQFLDLKAEEADKLAEKTARSRLFHNFKDGEVK